MENPWNKLNPKQKKIATIILAFIGVNLFFVGIFLLVRRLFNPPCEMGQKRYKEYGGLCGPICKDTQEVCPKKDDQGNYVTINCVEKCPADKTYDMETCNEKTGYCKKSCKSPAVAVNTEKGWDCGIYCPNDTTSGFPEHYCISTDICGSTKQGPHGKLVSGCIGTDGDSEKCDNSNFYCPKNTCKKDESGSYYCSIPMCNKTSFCKTNVKTNQCTYAGSCSKPLPVPAATDMATKGIDTDHIGICSVDQNASYEYCTDEQNLGIDLYGNLVVCRHGKEGVSLQGGKQCYNAIVGENIPCCKYGLCPNGWQCNVSSNLKDTSSCSSESFDKFKIGSKQCCTSGEHIYTDNDKVLCCPDILTEEKCLNRNKYPIDKEWANIDTTDELSCTQDGQCTQYKDKIKDKLGTNIDFDDETSPNYGTIFCNSGKCTLACGALQPLDDYGTIKRPPFLSINVEEDQESKTPASSFCSKNDSTLFIESIQGKALTYPDNDWNKESGTALNDNLLLCSTGETDNSYFWAQNYNNHTGDAGNYHNEFKYVINSNDPADCTKFPLISADQIDTGKITINRDLVQQKGSVKGTDQTECKARIQCNLAESMGFEKGQQIIPFDWYQGNKSLANVFPQGNKDMTQRVSKIMDESVCEDTQNPDKPEDCDLGSTPDSKFTSDQLVSPCYYNPNYPSTCLPKHVGITNIPPGHHIDKDTSLICNDSNNNCLPHYIYNGEYCRYGTIDGENCLQNSQKNNSC
jgi:hypothetical protein